MRTARSTLGLLAAALLLIAVPNALAAPGGGGGKPRLTIKAWDYGAMGKILGASKQCSAGRPMFVRQQGGAKPDPRVDKRLGQAGAKRTGALRAPLYLWLAKVRSAEKVYAEAGPRHGCAALRSRTISLPLSDAPVRECPEVSDLSSGVEGFCHISLHFEAPNCPRFDTGLAGSGCRGKIYGNEPWQVLTYDYWGETYGELAWREVGPNGERRVELLTRDHSARSASVRGFMRPPYRELYVDLAVATKLSSAIFASPQTQFPAGDLGGPLRVESVDSPSSTTDVYIRGYLLRVR